MKCMLENLPENGLRVGDPVILRCHSEAAIPFNTDPNANWQLELPKEQKYRLALEKVDSINPTEAVLIVASYQVGEEPVTGALLKQGENAVSLEPIALKVQTSFEATEEQKPIPPMGGATMPLPYQFWILLITLLSAVVVGFAIKVYVFRKRRKFLKWLNLQKLKIHSDDLSRALRKMARSASSDDHHELSKRLRELFSILLKTDLRSVALPKTRNLIKRSVLDQDLRQLMIDALVETEFPFDSRREKVMELFHLLINQLALEIKKNEGVAK